MESSAGNSASITYTACLVYIVYLMATVGAIDQYGDMTCVTENNGTVTVDIYIYKNTSNIATLRFVNQTHYFDACTWTGTGSRNDPFHASLRINPQTDDAPTGYVSCGHTVEEAGKAWRWIVYSEEEPTVFQDTDVIFNCTCNAKLVRSISNNATTIFVPDPGVALPTTGGRMELSITDTSHNPISEINLGDPFRLRLYFKPNNTDSLAAYGAYCTHLYATPVLSMLDTYVEVLNSQGCPRTDSEAFVPATSFVKQSSGSATEFVAMTGNIEARRFIVPHNLATEKVFFVCEADVCVRPQHTKCDQLCGTGSTIRKRSVDDMKVVASLDVRERRASAPGSHNEEGNTKTIPAMYLYLCIFGGSTCLILLLMLVVVILFFKKRNQRVRHPYKPYLDTPSMTSTITSQKSSQA